MELRISKLELALFQNGNDTKESVWAALLSDDIAMNSLGDSHADVSPTMFGGVAMRTVCLVVIFWLLSAASAPAQRPVPVQLPLAQWPVEEGMDPCVKASVGFSYFSLDMPTSSRVALLGPDVRLTSHCHPRIGLTTEVGYARASDVFGSGHNADVLTYLVGPVFYPPWKGRFATYIHGLFGGARVTGVVPLERGEVQLGVVNRPSWAFGGGVEYRLSPSFALQAGADYVHTAFFNSSKEIQGQGNLRFGVRLAFSLWGRTRR